MAHKTLIGGTDYDVTGGKARVNGTAYEITGGKALVGGTGYDVSFRGNPIPVYLNGHTDYMGYVIINGNSYYDGGGGLYEYVYAGDEIIFDPDGEYIAVYWFGEHYSGSTKVSYTVPKRTTAIYINMISDREYAYATFTVANDGFETP